MSWNSEKNVTSQIGRPEQATPMPQLRSSDKYVLWSVAVLAAFGVVAVYSAITFLAVSRVGIPAESFLYRHLVRTGIAFVAIIVFSRIDYHRVAAWSRPALVVSLGLLVLVQVIGVKTGGAERWLRIGPLSIQPSDLVRVALVIYVGFLLASKQLYISSFRRAFIPLLIWIIPAVLLIGVEDLSTAAMVLGSVLFMCFVARTRIAHLSSLALALALCASLFLYVSPERLVRVTNWVETGMFAGAEQGEGDIGGEGYQARQARIAFAMGGLTGRGPGKSVQRDFLPAPYNDFIFAIVAEEYGMVGAVSLLFLFCVLLFRGFMRIARAAPDPLGLFLAVGITTMIALYGFVNAGVACSLFPVTGLPMPFVSYGGTSLLASGVLIGVLLNISRSGQLDQMRVIA